VVGKYGRYVCITLLITVHLRMTNKHNPSGFSSIPIIMLPFFLYSSFDPYINLQYQYRKQKIKWQIITRK